MPANKQTLTKLKKKAWKEFSRYIRLKYADKNGNARCITCHKIDHWKNLQAGHFIPGRTNAILIHEDIVHPQCYRCNISLGGNLIEYFVFMEKSYGRKRVDEFRALKNQTKKVSKVEWIELAEKYKELANKLEKPGIVN